MNPSTEQAVADAIPHFGQCRIDRLLGRGERPCHCGATARRNVLLAKLSTQNGYVYLDRRH